MCKYIKFSFCFFTVPNPVVEVTSIGDVEFGRAATLECNVIAVRGITSRVDLHWIAIHNYNYTTVRRVENVTANIVNNSAVYTDQLVTPPLGVNDSGIVYSCQLISNRTYGVDRITLNFSGK